MSQRLPPTALPLHQTVKLFNSTSSSVLTVFRKMVFLLKASCLGWTVNHNLVFTASFVLLLMTIWELMCYICWSWSSNSSKGNVFSESNRSPILAQYSTFNMKVFGSEGLNIPCDFTRNCQEWTQESTFLWLWSSQNINLYYSRIN